MQTDPSVDSDPAVMCKVALKSITEIKKIYIVSFKTVFEDNLVGFQRYIVERAAQYNWLLCYSVACCIMP